MEVAGADEGWIEEDLQAMTQARCKVEEDIGSRRYRINHYAYDR